MENLYTCEELAERYKVKISTIWTWIRKGKLKAANYGKVYRITEKSIREFEKDR